MSAWRVIVKAVHAKGGQCRPFDLRGGLPLDDCTISQTLTVCKRMGLLDNEPTGQREMLWKLTPTGLDWCENRITQVWVRPGGRRWVSTWLASLPRGIRLQQEVASSA